MKILTRAVFSLGILVFLLCGLAILLMHQGFATKLFVLSFWILFLGTILYIVDLKNEK